MLRLSLTTLYELSYYDMDASLAKDKWFILNNEAANHKDDKRTCRIFWNSTNQRYSVFLAAANHNVKNCDVCRVANFNLPTLDWD